MENDNNFLYYHKWTVEDYELYKSSFSNEQMGELFFTVMQSVKPVRKLILTIQHFHLRTMCNITTL